MPIWVTRKVCLIGVHVKHDFRMYESLSLKMLDSLKTFSPTVEQYSIDEFLWEVYCGSFFMLGGITMFSTR